MAQPAFARLLNLLDIEATDAVPTAAVTLGGRSRLLLNPRFVAEKCLADHDLVMLVLHELHHVALGHTRLFARLTPAQNWAFDCVINAQLCRLYPRAASHGSLPALLSRRHDARSAPAPTRRLAHVAGALAARACWRGPSRVVQRGERDLPDLYRLLPTLAEDGVGTPATRSRRIASSGTTRVRVSKPTLRPTCCARCATSSRNGRWSSGSRDAIRERKSESSTIDRRQSLRDAAAILRKAILAIAEHGCGPSRGDRRRTEERDATLPYVLRPQRRDFLQTGDGRAVACSIRRGWTCRERCATSRCTSISTCPAAWTPRCPRSMQRSRRFRVSCTRRCTSSAPASTTSTHGSSRAACASPPAAPTSAPVTRHALDQRVRRALFVTDGWVGKVPGEHARELAKRAARFAAVVTHSGESASPTHLAQKCGGFPDLGKGP